MTPCKSPAKIIGIEEHELRLIICVNSWTFIEENGTQSFMFPSYSFII